MALSALFAPIAPVFTPVRHCQAGGCEQAIWRNQDWEKCPNTGLSHASAGYVYRSASIAVNAAQVADRYGVWLSATASMRRLWGDGPTGIKPPKALPPTKAIPAHVRPPSLEAAAQAI
jgi:hypothetical protein